MNTYRIYTSMDRTNFIEQQADNIGFDYNSGALVGYGPDSTIVSSEKSKGEILWFHPAGFGFTIVVEGQGIVYVLGQKQTKEIME